METIFWHNYVLPIPNYVIQVCVHSSLPKMTPPEETGSAFSRRHTDRTGVQQAVQKPKYLPTVNGEYKQHKQTCGVPDGAYSFPNRVPHNNIIPINTTPNQSVANSTVPV